MRLTTEDRAALAPLIAKFDAFRQTRESSRSRIPLALWQEAALAARSFTAEAVARALQVDVRSLRSHLGMKATQTPKVSKSKHPRSQDVVRVAPIIVNAAVTDRSQTLELKRPDGVSMLLRDPTSEVLAALIRDFLGGQAS